MFRFTRSIIAAGIIAASVGLTFVPATTASAATDGEAETCYAGPYYGSITQDAFADVMLWADPAEYYFECTDLLLGLQSGIMSGTEYYEANDVKFYAPNNEAYFETRASGLQSVVFADEQPAFDWSAFFLGVSTCALIVLLFIGFKAWGRMSRSDDDAKSDEVSESSADTTK